MIELYVKTVVKPSWENIYDMDVDEYEKQIDDDDGDTNELILIYEDEWVEGCIVVYIDEIREEYNKIKNGEK